MKLEAVLRNPYCAVLGEGPFWDADLQKLWWIDGLSEFGRGDDLHLFDPATGNDRAWHIGKHLGCALPLGDGRVMLALQDGIYLFAPETETMTRISDLEIEILNNRLNDGKCDSKGRLWLGSMSMTANQPDREFEVTGSFYRFAEGKPDKQFEGQASTCSTSVLWIRSPLCTSTVRLWAGIPAAILLLHWISPAIAPVRTNCWCGCGTTATALPCPGASRKPNGAASGTHPRAASGRLCGQRSSRMFT